MRGPQQVVHHDALVHFQTGPPRQVAVGPDTRGDNDQIGWDGAAIFQADAPYPPIANDLLRDGLRPLLDPSLNDVLVQDFPSPLVQLPW
jgi:hypothetical protein